MALIKLSSFITDIRGKLAGNVFQQSASGLTLKSNPKKIYKNSNRQNRAESILFVCQMEWLKLTDSQRDTWKAFATYNPVKQSNISGKVINAQQLFIRSNFYRLFYDFSILTVPQFAKCALTPVDLDLSESLGILSLEADRTVNASDEFLVILVTYLTPPTLNNAGNRYKMIKFTTTTDTSWDITSEYIDIYGTIPDSSETVFMKFTVVSLQSGLFMPIKTKKITVG